MINAKELRIGNLVKVPGYEVAVDFINVDLGFPEKYLINDWYEEDLEPIPLTEEWLLKFGFSVSDQPSWNVYEIGEWFILLMEKRDTKIILGALADNIPDVEIKFVHQLQNLYFALTGAELPIK